LESEWIKKERADAAKEAARQAEEDRFAHKRI